MTVEIHFRGPIPAKKNKWGPAGGRGIILDPRSKEEIQALIWQARSAWRDPATGDPYPPVEHAALEFTFHYPRFSADRDNKYTTLLDVLVCAGVFVDDNAARANGRHILNEVERGDSGAHVVVTFEPEQFSSRRPRQARARQRRAPARQL
jgi:hypothetical protein